MKLMIIIFIIFLFMVFYYFQHQNNELMIQNYLFNGDNNKINKIFENIKKPILWIYIPYEYNSRHWESFGSRSSLHLNQPYLYLTIQSIIQHCSNDFYICIIVIFVLI